MTYRMTERDPLGKVGRWFARLPRHLYSLHLGWILGRRFLLLEHIGQKSGLTRQAVLEVVRRDATSVDVAAAWGTGSDWYRNVRQQPAVHVSTGRIRHAQAVAKVVDQDDAAAAYADYAKEHPRAANALGAALHIPFDDPTAVAQAVPLVRIIFANAG